MTASIHVPYVVDFKAGNNITFFCLVPSISLDQESYSAMENATLGIAIFRSGDLTLPVTVYLTTAPISADNAALGK